MTIKWLSCQGKLLKGHLHTNNQQKKHEKENENIRKKRKTEEKKM